MRHASLEHAGQPCVVNQANLVGGFCCHGDAVPVPERRIYAYACNTLVLKALKVGLEGFGSVFGLDAAPCINGYVGMCHWCKFGKIIPYDGGQVEGLVLFDISWWQMPIILPLR